MFRKVPFDKNAFSLLLLLVVVVILLLVMLLLLIKKENFPLQFYINTLLH